MGSHLINHDPIPRCHANIVDQAARALAAPQLAATTPQYCNAAAAAAGDCRPHDQRACPSVHRHARGQTPNSGTSDADALFTAAPPAPRSPRYACHRGRRTWRSPRIASVTYCDGSLGPGPGCRGTARGTSAGRIHVRCVRSGRIPETLVQVERAVRPSSPLLIRGFGVRVPGGAPVVTWAISHIHEVDLWSGLQLGLQLAEVENWNLIPVMHGHS
jgi:hypothetical protein